MPKPLSKEDAALLRLLKTPPKPFTPKKPKVSRKASAKPSSPKTDGGKA
jgi:hypothetical protein